MPPKKGKKGGSKKKGGSTHHASGKKKGGGSSSTKKKGGDSKAQSSSIDLKAKRSELIDERFDGFVGDAHMSTFFGIFTKHNLKVFRTLVDRCAPPFATELTTDFIDGLPDFDMRDLNQFIFHVDNVVGAVVTSIVKKRIEIKAFMVLPRFRGYGFGSRLMVDLLKACDHRMATDTLAIQLPADVDERTVKFFTRFGFRTAKSQKVDDSKSADSKDSSLLLELRLQAFRQSISSAVKKALEDETGKGSETAEEKMDDSTIAGGVAES
jgi:ribosomal protein S18 acetylase RimI-like enzyme